MSTTTHTLETCLSLGCDDVSLEDGFRFTPGYAGDLTDPAAPDECEITSAFIVTRDARKPASAALVQTIDISERIYAEMCALAWQDRQPDPDAARDAALEVSL